MRRLPKHLTSNPSRLRKLRRYANEMANFYRLPVYLCGSALAEANMKPRDWDIRIEMTHEDFSRRFGDAWKWEEEGAIGDWSDVRWHWSDECVKRTKTGWRMTGLNIDFQIYTVGYANQYRNNPKVRLDTTKWKAAKETNPDVVIVKSIKV